MTLPKSTDTLIAISHAGSGKILVYRPADGWTRLELVQMLNAAAGRATPVSMPMAFLPRRGVLVAALRSEPWPIVSYALDPATHLFTALGEGRLNGSAPFIISSEDETVLLSVINPGAAAVVQVLDKRGVPADAGVRCDGMPKAHCIVTSGSCAYVASVDGGRIDQFVVTPSGLEPLDPLSVPLTNGGDPRHLAVSSDGRALYAVTEAAGTVVHFAIGGDGRLAERSCVQVWPAGIGACEAADIVVTERLLFASERRSSTIAVLRLRADGTPELARLVKTGPSPRAVCLSPDGAFLTVAAELSDTLFIYRIDVMAADIAEICRIAVDTTPNWITMIPIEGPSL